MQHRTPSQGPQLCSSCGTKLIAGDCVECDRPRATARGLKQPAAPARAYGEVAGRIEPVTDYRRSSGEWLAQPTDDAPATRRAHPGQVRTALAEAEVKAQQKVESQAQRKITLNAIAAVRAEREEAAAPSERERNADGSARRSTAPRVRVVTPLPPNAELVTAPPPEPSPTRPKTVPRLVVSTAAGPTHDSHRRMLWAYALGGAGIAAAVAFLLLK